MAKILSDNKPCIFLNVFAPALRKIKPAPGFCSIVSKRYLHINNVEGTINIMRTNIELPVPLFRSDTQGALLAALFMAESKISIQELSENLDLPYSTLHREVTRLLDSGLVNEEKTGNYRFFLPNRSSPFYRPLYDLLQIYAGPVPKLKKELQSIEGIEWCALFGSWAQRLLGKEGRPPQDIDVLVIGTPEVREVNRACALVSKSLGWEVNPVILTMQEWKEDSPFLRQVRTDGMVTIMGKSE